MFPEILWILNSHVKYERRSWTTANQWKVGEKDRKSHVWLPLMGDSSTMSQQTEILFPSFPGRFDAMTFVNTSSKHSPYSREFHFYSITNKIFMELFKQKHKTPVIAFFLYGRIQFFKKPLFLLYNEAAIIEVLKTQWIIRWIFAIFSEVLSALT